VNQATQAQLEVLKGLGPALAERVVLARRAGVFMSWDDLAQRVKGLGPAKLQQLQTLGLALNPCP
jgi:competence protein ComEA